MKKLFSDANLHELLQVNHQGVFRWGSFLEKDKKLRHQNNLHHIVSVSHVATVVCMKLSKSISFDRFFVLAAFNVHEHGEAITQNDTVYDEKKNDATDDVKEYNLFMSKMEESYIDGFLISELEKAFLLQFVTQEHKWKSFSKKAQSIFLHLKRNFHLEAQIFNAIERYEYFYYPLESSNIHNVELLLNVIKNQAHHLDEYAVSISGFANIWTPRHSVVAQDLLKLEKFKSAEELKDIILDESVTDAAVRREIEKLGISILTEEESEQILKLVQKERPELYRTWVHDVASGYF